MYLRIEISSSTGDKSLLSSNRAYLLSQLDFCEDHFRRILWAIEAHLYFVIGRPGCVDLSDLIRFLLSSDIFFLFIISSNYFFHTMIWYGWMLCFFAVGLMFISLQYASSTIFNFSFSWMYVFIFSTLQYLKLPKIFEHKRVVFNYFLLKFCCYLQDVYNMASFFLNKKKIYLHFSNFRHHLTHIWCQRIQQCKSFSFKVTTLPTLFLICNPL